MSLNPREMESKAQMLVNEPGYDIPEDIRGIHRARIQGRADVIVRQNDAIARLNPAPGPTPGPTPEPEPTTQEPSTSGGKKRKSKRSKKSKKNKSKRIKRKTRR